MVTRAFQLNRNNKGPCGLASYPGLFTLSVWEEKKGLVPTVLLTSHFSMIFRKMSSRLCIYMLCLLSRGSPKVLHHFVQPDGVEGRPSWILLVPFTEGHGLPPFVCQNCRVKAESIESKLHKFREPARQLQQVPRTMKQASTGVGASPYTQHVQPAAKRLR